MSVNTIASSRPVTSQSLSAPTAAELHQAIKNRKPLSEIRALITKENVNSFCESQSALHLAVYDAELVRALLDEGANIDFPTEDTGESALYLAVKGGYTKSVKLLVEKGANHGNLYEEGKSSLLHCAVALGFLEIAEFLLKSGVNSKIQTLDGESILFSAIRSDNEAMVDLLLKEELSLTQALDKKGNTPLYVAIISESKNHLRISEKLIAAGCDVNQISRKKTPLYQAVKLGLKNEVAFLLHHKANPDIKCTDDQVTALHVAFTVEIFKMLIEAGADFYAKSALNENILHSAVISNYHLVACYIISEKKLDVNQIGGSDEMTPLHCAVLNQSYRLTELLLESGANPNIQSKSLVTPLYLAVSTPYSPDENTRTLIATLLLDKGAHVDQDCGPESGTALHAAARKGNVSLVKLLLAKKANIHACKTSGVSVLGEAAIYGQIEVVKVLIEQKADVNQRCGLTEFTPLRFATFCSNIDVFKELILAGADLFALAKGNLSILHSAVLCHNMEIVDYWLEKGLSLEAKTDKGQTALHLASESGFSSMVKKLLIAGAEIHSMTHRRETPLYLALAASINPEILSKLIMKATNFEETFTVLLDSEIKNLDLSLKAFAQSGDKKEPILCLFRDLSCFTLYLQFLNKNSKFTVLNSFNSLILHKMSRFIFGNLISPDFWHGVRNLPFNTFENEELLQFNSSLKNLKRIFSHILKAPLNLEFVILNIEPILNHTTGLLEKQQSASNANKILDINEQENEFDEQDIFILLSSLTLGAGSNYFGYNAEQSYVNLLGCSVEEVGQIFGTKGEDLRNKGVTFTLRFIADAIEMHKGFEEKRKLWKEALEKINLLKPFADKAIVEDLNSLQTKIGFHLGSHETEFQLREKEMLGGLRECHKEYALSVLRYVVKNREAPPAKKQKIEQT